MTTDNATSATTDAAASTASGYNTVNWWEIQVPDFAGAQSFYGSVFGWTFQPFGDTYAMIFTADGTMIGGLDEVQREPAGRHVRIYVKVADLDATLAAIEAAGGTVHEHRQHISDDYGWYATAADPWDLRFGLTTGNPPAEG